MFILGLLYPLFTIAQTAPGYETPVLEGTSTEGIALSVIPPAPTVRDLVVYEFRDAPVMVRIAAAESSFDPEAKNPGSTATGLFQILSGTWDAYHCTGERTDPEDNIACARKLYTAQGTSPWNSSKGVWYPK